MKGKAVNRAWVAHSGQQDGGGVNRSAMWGSDVIKLSLAEQLQLAPEQHSTGECERTKIKLNLGEMP